MAKATTTMKQSLNYRPQHAAWFAANQALYNRVVAFYFDCIQAHAGIVDLPNKEALTALEKLTHATRKHPSPILPLTQIAPDIPAMFRRAAINAAMGSARAFFSSLNAWRARKEKAEASKSRKRPKKKPFTQRPPVPPRCWNKAVPLYSGMWKERRGSSIVLKIWTGKCWSWMKVRTLSRDLPNGFQRQSPALVRRGQKWWLHTPIEKTFTAPSKIAEQLTKTETKICSVDLNLNEQVAVCTVQTVEGTILATRFIGGGRRVAGFRKKLLGRIARNRSQTGIIAQDEQDNAALWRKIRNTDEHLAHLVSARIVQFAAEQGACLLVFEHLGNLKPTKGKYSHRGNTKRAFWMKGRIFTSAKYKAWNQGIITSRVNPRKTSRECHRCHALVVRYEQGQPEMGYTPGTPLCLCPQCSLRGNADRNASLLVGQRLIARSHQPFKEKPQTPVRRAGRESKDSGVVLPQDAERKEKPSFSQARQGDSNGHGTAQGSRRRMGSPSSSIPRQLRLFNE
jgi:transposase